MKALTVRQPWASLIAGGHKRYETRGWQPPAGLLGERFAIHAGLSTVNLAFAESPRFAQALPDGPLPLGAIVATARLASVLPVDRTVWRYMQGSRRHAAEFAFGDWQIGRFGWLLQDVQRLDVPIPAKGKQGLWTVPEDIETTIQEGTYAR